MVVFNTGLNEFGRKYIIKNEGEDEKVLLETWHDEQAACEAEMIEQLLFFDKISIKVYGENLPLMILLNKLGLKQVMELIEEDAIEFVLWTPSLLTLQGEDLTGKAMPIVSGNVNSEVHSNPEVSVKESFIRMTHPPERKDRRSLEKSIVKKYKIPRINFAHDAADIVMSAYTDNKLLHAGLENNKDIKQLKYDERLKLIKIGEQVLETAILAEYKYGSLGNYDYYTIAEQAYQSIRKASTIINSSEAIFKTESLPNVRNLIAEGKIDLNSLVRLRRKASSKKYRSWLEDDLRDSEYITQQYVDEIANHKGFFERNPGKFLKVLGMFGIGAAVGSAVASIQGPIAGTAIGGLVGKGTDFGLSLIDSYLLEGIIKGWTPKIFINEFQKVITLSKPQPPIKS